MIDWLQAWPDASGAKAARQLLHTATGDVADGVWAAPGRVNLIGEHVDYNGGICLPIALPHRTFVAMRRRSDDRVRLVSDASGAGLWEGRLSDLVPGSGLGWAAYAGGPAWSFAKSKLPVAGFDAAITSCVPLGAGLSSSAAVECAVALGLDELNELGLAATDQGRTRLAALCMQAENEVAGAHTGGLDQAASLRATAGHALELDCLDDSIRQVPFDLEPSGLVLLVVDTRAPHALADGQYAARRAVCERAAAILEVQTLRHVATDAELDRLADPIDRKRARHVVTEIRRVIDFVRATTEGRFEDAGRLMFESHASLQCDYEVSCPELDLVVDTARSANALGARMTGGGFGGSAIVLIAAEKSETLADAISDAFAAQGLRQPGFLRATAAGGGGRVA